MIILILLVLIFILSLLFYKQIVQNKKNFKTLKSKLVEENNALKSKIIQVNSDLKKAQETTKETINKINTKEMQLLQQSRLSQDAEILSMIAHQWKQPLGTISASAIAIVMAIELKQYNLDDKNSREEFLKFVIFKLSNISSYVKNLSNIISDFSDFYKPNKNSEVLNLDKVILKVNTLFGDSISAKGILLKFKLDADCEVYIHENEFMQVILNILNNAKEQLILKQKENAKINITTYTIGDDVFIEIQDNAGGICEENINNIFNPYFSTKLEKNGTGLGLYMSKIIINDYHDGSLSVKNIDDGVMFTIRISKW